MRTMMAVSVVLLALGCGKPASQIATKAESVANPTIPQDDGPWAKSKADADREAEAEAEAKLLQDAKSDPVMAYLDPLKLEVGQVGEFPISTPWEFRRNLAPTVAVIGHEANEFLAVCVDTSKVVAKPGSADVANRPVVLPGKWRVARVEKLGEYTIFAIEAEGEAPSKVEAKPDPPAPKKPSPVEPELDIDSSSVASFAGVPQLDTAKLTVGDIGDLDPEATYLPTGAKGDDTILSTAIKSVVLRVATKLLEPASDKDDEKAMRLPGVWKVASKSRVSIGTVEYQLKASTESEAKEHADAVSKEEATEKPAKGVAGATSPQTPPAVGARAGVPVQVKGYTTKSGRYVAPYSRMAPSRR